MISVVSQNCSGFIKQNGADSRTQMLMPLVLLLDRERFETEGTETILFKKACDLYNYIIDQPETYKYKRLSLFRVELKLRYAEMSFKKYDLLSGDELEYIIDFIDTYGGFRVYQ